MVKVLLQAAAFILIMVIAYVLKKIGFFRPQDDQVLSKIMFKITLPASIVVAFSKFQPEQEMLVIVLLGFGSNLLLSSLGILLARKKPPVHKAFQLINFSGFNIGCFALPFVQNFLGPAGIVTAYMFDAGNSIMCTGGTLAWASAYSGTEKPSWKSSLKKLFSSVPFDMYVLFFTLSLLHITPPEVIFTFAQPMANANPFIAMFMIGLIFECDFSKGKGKIILLNLLVRYGCCGILAVFFYFVLPLPLVVRQVLVLAVFAPISALTPVFTEKTGGDKALAGLINSMSIPISVVILTTLLAAMGLG